LENGKKKEQKKIELNILHRVLFKRRSKLKSTFPLCEKYNQILAVSLIFFIMQA
jgi:hypothetical protein